VKFEKSQKASVSRARRCIGPLSIANGKWQWHFHFPNSSRIGKDNNTFIQLQLLLLLILFASLFIIYI